MTEEQFDPTGGALALNALPPKQSGLAAGANQTFRQVGVAVGIARSAHWCRPRRSPGGDLEAYVDGLHHALIVCTLLALAGSVATAWLLVPAEGRAEPGVRRRRHDTRAKAPGIDGRERIAQGARK